LRAEAQYTMKRLSPAACFAAAVLSAGLLMAQPAPSAGQNRMANRLDKIADLLNLTGDQRTQVQNILQNAHTQAQALAPQMKSNRQALETLIKSSAGAPDFEGKLQSLANQESSLMSQMIVIHGKAMAQVWALLTPDQQQKAGDLFALLRPGFGMGGGMGRMQGMHGGMGPRQ
jgi:Spy/CpxP family protein refolding chaperone